MKPAVVINHWSHRAKSLGHMSGKQMAGVGAVSDGGAWAGDMGQVGGGHFGPALNHNFSKPNS